MLRKKNRRAAFLIIYCDPFGDSQYERFLIATRWSGAYGFIGGEIKEEEAVKDGLIRECIEEIVINFNNRKEYFRELNYSYSNNKHMEFYTYTLKVSSEEIKKIWNEWRENGEFAEHEISGLSLMRTDEKIINNFMKNNFSGNSKNDMFNFLEFLKK